MQIAKQGVVHHELLQITSSLLQRTVKLDCFMPDRFDAGSGVELLLMNDGQHMQELGGRAMFEDLMESGAISPFLCVAIHAGDRISEYGTASTTDYLGRGYKAPAYTQFIFEELLPFIKDKYGIISFSQKSFAGFSLGGLSALDIVWNHPDEFSKAGVFSGSLWWRDKALDDGYVEETDRIMHAQVRKGQYHPSLKFFFETGTHDETMDRNHNGIIDSIDDTLGLIEELVKKGYDPQTQIMYLELAQGRHDIATWAQAMPAFLEWGWGEKF